MPGTGGGCGMGGRVGRGSAIITWPAIWLLEWRRILLCYPNLQGSRAAWMLLVTRWFYY